MEEQHMDDQETGTTDPGPAEGTDTGPAEVTNPDQPGVAPEVTKVDEEQAKEPEPKPVVFEKVTATVVDKGLQVLADLAHGRMSREDGRKWLAENYPDLA